MRHTLIAATALLMLAAAPPGPATPAESRAPRIWLAPSADGSWRVRYELGEPATSLGFTRAHSNWRVKRWTPVDELKLLHDGDGTRAQRVDGAPFREAAFDTPARYQHVPKDYAPFSPFSDGGLLIHTGQFHACAAGAPCPGDAAWPLSITPPMGAHSIVQGAVHTGAVDIRSSGSGTNVYVGSARPLEASHFIAVIDAGLPAEVKDALHRLLPPLMDHFTGLLGPLPEKPMLFASLDPHPPKGSGYNSQGGTLPNQIFIHLYGEKWAKGAGEQVGGRLPWFFAHEAAHLFQSAGVADDYTMEQSWIHEGGADAFAALTIAKLGGASDEYVNGRIKRALDECGSGLKTLDGKPLNASGETGAFENYYACGLLMQLAIDAELRRASEGKQDLFDLWSAYLGRLRAGAPTNQDTFLGVAGEMGARGAAAFARALATVPQRDPKAFIRSELAKAGLALAD
ncbi:MAG: hypothetical protein ACREAA_16110 [Candidatus Polarisedimenticolia bacterium]